MFYLHGSLKCDNAYSGASGKVGHKQALLLNWHRERGLKYLSLYIRIYIYLLIYIYIYVCVCVCVCVCARARVCV